MIGSIKHKGLKRLYEKGDESKISADLLSKVNRIMALLDVATSPDELDLPAFRLHPLKGNMKGYYAVSVSGNWRITFRFEGETPNDVDLVDYH